MSKMNKKNGITLIMLVITLIIMAILATVTIFSVNSSIKFSKYTAWANEIKYVQDIVDESLNSTYLIAETIGSVYLDVVAGTSEQFEEEVVADSKIELLILDLDKLGIVNTVYGNMNSETDVYALSASTGRVYYVAGMEIDGTTYYTLTNSLLDMFGIENDETVLSTVIFRPNKLGFTNSPVSVTVKVPAIFTNVAISASNNNIAISEAQLKDNVYEYQVNANNIQENYTITVTYTNLGNNFSVKYDVNGYDVVAPIIHEDTSLSDVIRAVAEDSSGIKILKYEYGIINQENAEEYFVSNGKNITNGKIKVVEDITKYTIYAEDNAGNFSVKAVFLSGVVQAVSGVPIPRGFAPSPYEGENTKEDGFVIYQLTDSEIQSGITELPQEEQYTSWTTRNQYVWVPVETSTFKTEFVRRTFGQSFTLSNVPGEEYWELQLDEDNMPVSVSKTNAYISQETVAEAKAMYESVAKYGGFYVARYEAGINNQRQSVGEAVIKGRENVFFMMNKIPYTYIMWSSSESMNVDTGGMVEVARGIYPKDDSNFGVVSTLIYGIQWDATTQWFLDTGALTDVISNTRNHGNYADSIINYSDLNLNALYSVEDSASGKMTEYVPVTSEMTKASSVHWLLTTGALKYASINNIYDMAGNLHERTMEAHGTVERVYRGGLFSGSDTRFTLGGRFYNGSQATGNYTNGFRIALYLK